MNFSASVPIALTRRLWKTLQETYHPAPWDRQLRRLARSYKRFGRSAGPDDVHIMFVSRPLVHVGLLELLLGVALREYGCKVSYVIWDGVGLSNLNSVRRSSPDYQRFYKRFVDLAGDLELPHYCSSEFFTDEDKSLHKEFVASLPSNGCSHLSDWKSVRFRDVDLGKVVHASVLRWLQADCLDNGLGETEASVYRGFLETTSRFMLQLENAMAELKPDRLLVLNGKYALQATAFHLAHRLRIPVTNYEVGGWFSNSVSVLDADISGPEWPRWQDAPLSQSARKLWERSKRDRRRVYYPGKCGFDVSRFGVFDLLCTNIRWDLSWIDANSIFPSMMDFIYETIEWYTIRKKNLVIRIHPADDKPWDEVESTPVADVLYQRFGTFPSNIFLIRPKDQLPTYDLLPRAQKIIVYASTIGLEAAMMGRRVIVAGLPPYGRKGFTFEPHSKQDYFDSLSTTLEELSEEETELANRFGFYYLLRRPIPLKLIEREPLRNVVAPRRICTDIRKMRPGKNPFLDFVMHHTIYNGDFVMPEHLVFKAARVNPLLF